MKKLFAMAAIALFMASCSGEEDTEPVNNEQSPVVENPLPKDIKILSADGLLKTMHFDYTDEWYNAITKITYEDGSYDEFFYDFYHDITRINKIKDGEIIEYTLFEYHEGSRLTKKTRYVYVENNTVPLVYISNISYNTSNHVHIGQYSENDPDFETQSNSYESYFNHFVYTEDNNTNISRSYEYDTTTRPPFLFVYGIDNLRWIYPYFTDKNVIMTRKYINGVNAGQDRYEYIYNGQSYPAEVKRYNNANNQLFDTTTYTYYNLE